MSSLFAFAGQRIVNRLRTSLFSSVLRQEVAFFDKTRTGELINRLSSDTALLGRSVTENLSDGLRAGAQASIGIGMMVCQPDWRRCLLIRALAIAGPLSQGMSYPHHPVSHLTRSAATEATGHMGIASSCAAACNLYLSGMTCYLECGLLAFRKDYIIAWVF